MLAEELGQFACRMGDGRIAGRFVRRMRGLDSGLPDLARHLRTGCPALIAELGAEDKQTLEKAEPQKAGTASTASTL